MRPIVLGHSLGGFVAILYGARHADQAGGLVLRSTMARFHLEHLVDGFRRVAGDEIAALARREYDGDSVTTDEWATVFAAFGPRIPSNEELARRTRNPAVVDPASSSCAVSTSSISSRGSPARRSSASEASIRSRPWRRPGDRRRLPAGIGTLEVIDGAGHFPWLDAPERYLALVLSFLAVVSAS